MRGAFGVLVAVLVALGVVELAKWSPSIAVFAGFAVFLGWQATLLDR